MRTRFSLLPACLLVLSLAACRTAPAAAGTAAKTESAFFPRALVEELRRNMADPAWAAFRQSVVLRAGPWMMKSDEDLWNMPFGATLPRSWMVLSDGVCPQCGGDVPMYNWKMDALKRPWKVQCPYCAKLFPTNDFKGFYGSGLGADGVFDPARADRSLLYNADHPDPKDPLHSFGVDDGNGWSDGKRTWRFIAAYLVYGQWKQAVLGGINALSDAWLVTAKPGYAHAAAILLDRVADLYPSFDYASQGFNYEKKGTNGYVSVWHDTCEETKQLVIAYDRVFPAIDGDADLVAFLSRKAAETGNPNRKETPSRIRENIERRILADAFDHPAKIHSNFPRREITQAVIRGVLGGLGDRRMAEITDGLIGRATAVDGVTGEKGLSGYASFTVGGLADYLELCSRAQPSFLSGALERHPALSRTWRFHVDTLCLGLFYPRSGDCGSFARPDGQYVGVAVNRAPSLNPSMAAFLARLAEATGDASYLQTLYTENGRSAAGLPYDPFAADPEAVRRRVADAVAAHGPEALPGSVNLTQWHMAILRSGEGKDRRALWLDYDSRGGHGHADGLTLGLFAKGMDLLPDFGYPPVQYGGWDAPRARWYLATLAHDTVTVDGKSQNAVPGKTTLWADGRTLQAVGAALPLPFDLVKRYERTVAMVRVSDADSYVVDVFRAAGGFDHALIAGSGLGELSLEGLSPVPRTERLLLGETRNWRNDPAPRAGWTAEWRLADPVATVPAPTAVRLRYRDFTDKAEVSPHEAWVSTARGSYASNESAWIPRLAIRRKSGFADLESTFVGVLEPYEGAPFLAGARRLPLHMASGGVPAGDSCVALEVLLADGRRDLVLAPDGPGAVIQEDWGVRFRGPLCLVRERGGKRELVALAGPGTLSMKGLSVSLKEGSAGVELELGADGPRVVSGDPAGVSWSVTP